MKLVVKISEELAKMPLELISEERDGAIVVRAQGKRIYAGEAPVVQEMLTRHIEAGPRKIVLDLTQVEFIDTVGLGALVACLKLLGEPGRLAIVGAHGTVARLFELTNMDRVFPLYDSLDDALRG